MNRIFILILLAIGLGFKAQIKTYKITFQKVYNLEEYKNDSLEMHERRKNAKDLFYLFVNEKYSLFIPAKEDNISELEFVVKDYDKDFCLYQYTDGVQYTKRAKGMHLYTDTDEKKIILGHPCRKATLDNGQYAYYAEDIALQGTPAEMGMMPGMILDFQLMEARYTAIAIEEIDENINIQPYMQQYKKKTDE
ncbi:GLPGLI family protein [Riemerella anatipestifer]|uniref:GLPGLI family protein n=1 Tax=Riemerella anatipestifer TaxID=34085 RepID=UPI0012AD5E99|nr:GLPGLI family protein [Riemerella anatipestifer]MCO7319136.1 GLPGLI family protein [Riemerella anatipestifer]MCQ4155422.1 GLPGLI family protein [Riemerella anatipestifer]MCQ4181372.1 GLPGLI family protein [Riemerella anatipestifer]MCW0474653.1 GLPGLI family protein [Riemerella anatipestifer]MDR7775501.1 GLPGLI family protein [Riemerella anatipestifer]